MIPIRFDFSHADLRSREHRSGRRIGAGTWRKGVAVLLSAFLVLQGCASLGDRQCTKRHAVNAIVPTLEDFHDVALRCDDLELLRTTIQAYFLLFQTLVHESPDNPRLASLYSMLCAYYGFGFLVDEDVEKARAYYWRGIETGKAALRLNRSLGKALDKGEPLYKAVSRLRPDRDVPAAFATALNQGMLLICSLDVPEALAEANSFRALTEWIIQQDDTYWSGGAHSLLGVYFAIMPAMAGGGPAKARKEFDKAMKIAPNFLLHKYLYARYVPTLIDDEPMFDRMILEILDAHADAEPDYVALNLIAKRKARILEGDRDRFF